MSTEPQTEHRYTYPDAPEPEQEPREEPAGSRRHRAVRPAETDAQLVLRAAGWAAMWYFLAVAFSSTLLGHWYGPMGADWINGLPTAALSLVLTANGHRRRQR